LPQQAEPEVNVHCSSQASTLTSMSAQLPDCIGRSKLCIMTSTACFTNVGEGLKCRDVHSASSSCSLVVYPPCYLSYPNPPDANPRNLYPPMHPTTIICELFPNRTCAAMHPSTSSSNPSHSHSSALVQVSLSVSHFHSTPIVAQYSRNKHSCKTTRLKSIQRPRRSLFLSIPLPN